jgi:hypothetical protein
VVGVATAQAHLHYSPTPGGGRHDAPRHVAARLASSSLRQAWLCGGCGGPWWTMRLLVVLHEAPPLRPGRPRWSGATSASVEWHDRPRPGGATSTMARRRDLDLVLAARPRPSPAASSFTSSRRRRPRPRPGGATSTRSGVLDLGALCARVRLLHTPLTSLSIAALPPTSTAAGLAKGSTAPESGVRRGQRHWLHHHERARTTMARGPGSRPDGARSGLNFFYC